MDIITIPGSRIVEVARLAFAAPDVEFLCFGESDQPSPQSAHDAAVAALDAGFTRYPDVRGVPALRDALAAYLTALHAKPVAEERIQVAASGMAAMSVALAATVRAGDRVVVHSPLWPNIGNAVHLRSAELMTRPRRAGRRQLPPGPRPAGLCAARCSGVHPQFAEQSDRLDRHKGRTASHPGDGPPPRRLADLR